MKAKIARICHEVNRAYCDAIGDSASEPWDDAPDWQRESILAGVEAHLKNIDLTPAESHQCWLDTKKAEGWTYGPVKDVDKKQHPCMVPFIELPINQRVKDFLFKAIVLACVQNQAAEDLALDTMVNNIRTACNGGGISTGYRISALRLIEQELLTALDE